MTQESRVAPSCAAFLYADFGCKESQCGEVVRKTATILVLHRGLISQSGDLDGFFDRARVNSHIRVNKFNSSKVAGGGQLL